MEIHWLSERGLPQIKRELAQVGLTSRGACGGAVRGVTCGSQDAQGFPALETLARRLQSHFTGNPRFERLPKKFKIGIEADVSGGRHLIQDVGLVLSRVEEGRDRFDIWIAGLSRSSRP
jgi:sulfite reductase (ferredoxin)